MDYNNNPTNNLEGSNNFFNYPNYSTMNVNNMNNMDNNKSNMDYIKRNNFPNSSNNNIDSDSSPGGLLSDSINDLANSNNNTFTFGVNNTNTNDMNPYSNVNFKNYNSMNNPEILNPNLYPTQKSIMEQPDDTDKNKFVGIGSSYMNNNNLGGNNDNENKFNVRMPVNLNAPDNNNDKFN